MFEHLHHVHLVGANGVGLSAVGKLLLKRGVGVSGSELHAGLFSDELERLGAKIYSEHAAENIPTDLDLLLYSSAVPEDNPERQAARERGVPEMMLAEFLGELSRSARTIAVTGTHGKSTTTAMIGKILEAAGFDPTVIVGSRVPGWELGNVRVGDGQWLVMEACEYRENHLKIAPEVAVVTNIEEDHLDYYRDLDHIKEAMQAFVAQSSVQNAVLNREDPASQKIRSKQIAWFSSDDTADLLLQIPGAYNRSNAAAASAVARCLEISDDLSRSALEAFTGIWRRFERIGEWHGAEVISDYGHHPTAIRDVLVAAREMFPGRRLVHIFQPHQHARTKDLFEGFVEALGRADVTIVPEIYEVAGRTEVHDVSSRDLVEAVRKVRPSAVISFAHDLVEAERQLRDVVRAGDVVLIQGAGDVDDLARSFVKKMGTPLRPHPTSSSLADSLRVVGDPRSCDPFSQRVPASEARAFLALFGDRVKIDEPMKKHTNFRIGGPARWYFEAATDEELAQVVSIARSHGVRVVIHGGGSNSLYADRGVDALVIVPAMRDVVISDMQVTAGAGAPSALLARKTAEAGLAGLTWMISLPGSVGGAVRGNAGCFGGETKDHIVSIEVYKPTEGRVETISKADLDLRYRHSCLKENDWIVLSATFALESGDRAALLALLDENIAARKEGQPTNVGSAGCAFKNYEVKDADELKRLDAKLHLTEAMKYSLRIGAGFIVDRLELKGTKIGGAEVSDKHGNFLVNTGEATADDVLQLISLIKTRVRNELGIQLEEEVVYIQ